MSPYEILQIPPTSTPAEIRRAYRAMALATHPDRNPDDAMAGERFRAVRAAYDTVKNGLNPFAHFGPVFTPNAKYGGLDISWKPWYDRDLDREQLEKSWRKDPTCDPRLNIRRESKFITPDQPGHPDYFK